MKLNTKKTLAALTAFVLAATTAAPSAFAATFNDVPSTHWANTAISRAADAGIMTGIGNNQFAPSKTLTKAEFAAILTRAFYPDEYAAAQKTETGAWYAPAKAVAQKHLLFSGLSDFGENMDRTINRYDMAAMISALLHRKGKEATSDVDEEMAYGEKNIVDWKKIVNSSADEGRWQSVAQCYMAGILQGTGADGAFNGDAYMDRASTAMVYGRLADLIGGGTYTPPKEETPQPSEDIEVAETPAKLPAEDENIIYKYEVINGVKVATYTEGFQFTEDELEMARRINIERAKRSKDDGVYRCPGILSERLTRAARIRASEISVLYEHKRPDGSHIRTVLEEVGYKYEGSPGENIFMTSLDSSPAYAMNRFIASKGHYYNLTMGTKSMGIAKYDIDGKSHWVQLFL